MRKLISALSLGLIVASNSLYAGQIEKDAAVAVFAEMIGDKADAQRRYEKLTADYPSSAEAWFYLGQFQSLQKNYAGSDSSLKKALELDSKYKNANLILGRNAFEQNDYAQAQQYLDRELSINKKSGDAHYWKARVLEQQKDWAGAKRAYDQALDKKTGHASEAKIGRLIVAQELGEKPESPTSESPSQVETKERPWDLRIGSGFLYTDNVAGTDNKVEKAPDLRRRWDMGWNYDLSASYKFINTEKFDFSTHYALDHTIWFQAEDLNQLTNQIVLDPQYKVTENLTVGNDLSWTHQTLSGEPYRFELGWKPWAGYQWKRFYFVTAYDASRGYYHFYPGNEKQNRDNITQKLHEQIIYYPEKYLQSISTGLTMGREDARGSDYDSYFLSPYLSTRTKEWKTLTLKNSIYTGWNKYSDANTAALVTESQKRHGQDFGFGAEISKRFGDSGLRTYVRYDYARRYSNITFYSNTSNTVSSGVKYEF